MIDIGLLATIAVMLTLPAVFIRPWPDDAVPTGILDLTLGAAFVGLAVGRVTALALDDPSSLTGLSDLLIIRSGVEFWPGAAAGIAWLAFNAHRQRASAMRRLAALVPAGLIAWACFEATCLVRGGCPGPISAFGLHPEGLVARMFPVGLAVAVVAFAVALALDRLHRRGIPDVQIVLAAAFSVGLIRSIASIWLPKVGDGLTRQHRESIAVSVLTVSALAVARTRSRTTMRTASA